MANQAQLEALADPTRRAIFERLGERGPMAVGQIAAELPVSRPAVSQHLRVLKGAALVRDSRRGTRRLYRVDVAGIAEVREYFDSFWQRALAAFKEAVDEPPNNSSRAEEKSHGHGN